MQGHTGECNAIIHNSKVSIKIETLSWVKMDRGKKGRPHTVTADWTGSFALGNLWLQPQLGSQIPLVIDTTLEYRCSGEKAATQQATFYKVGLKSHTIFFVVVRKVMSEKTRARWGGRRKLPLKTNEFKWQTTILVYIYLPCLPDPPATHEVPWTVRIATN